MNRMRSKSDQYLEQVPSCSVDFSKSFGHVEDLAVLGAEVRLGMVNYINTAPIYEPWKRRGALPGCYVLEAPPATLNHFLAKGELDLGFVSCFEYAMRPQEYRILPDLSISANGPVGSVFLFSKLPVKDLAGQRILLTSQSETSVALTRIVLEEFNKLEVSYFSGEVNTENIDNCSALLAIGDDALRIAENNEFAVQLDLGEVWMQETGLPFVFAVCAVREDFCRRHPEKLEEVYGHLLSCREEGLQRMDEICKVAARRIPMDVEDCRNYLQGIEYDLGPRKIEALEKFFNYLIVRNEVSPMALPLKIHTIAGA